MSVPQEDYIAFNQYNSQMNGLMQQKNQLKMVVDNINNSLEELTKNKSDDIYKNLGQILIKTTKEKVTKDLNSELETLTVRIKTVNKQEEIITKKLDSLKTKLEAATKANEKKK